MRYVINYTGNDQGLRQELMQISEAIEELNGWYVPIAYSTPPDPQRGQLVYADAAHWDPGSGTGVYSFDGSSWNKIGTTAGGGATQLGELSDVNNTIAKTNRNALIADGSLFQSRALVEADISDLGNYAAKDGTETITGAWTFDQDITVDGFVLNEPGTGNHFRINQSDDLAWMTMGFVADNNYFYVDGGGASAGLSWRNWTRLTFQNTAIRQYNTTVGKQYDLNVDSAGNIMWNAMGSAVGMDLASFSGPLRLRDGMEFRVQNVSDNKYVSVLHNDTDGVINSTSGDLALSSSAGNVRVDDDLIVSGNIKAANFDEALSYFLGD